MGAAQQLIDENHLNRFTPLSTLTPTLLDEVIRQASVERFPPGHRLFNQHQRDQKTHFLLSGQLALITDGEPSSMLRADSPEAHCPIAPGQPRRLTALASTSVTVLSIDSAILDELLQCNQTNNDGSAADPAANDRPLSPALTSPLFSRLPRPHLQVLRKRLTEITACAGETIIREGDPGDDYYLIAAGRARVSRHSGKCRRPAILAELEAGDGFGEGALISHDRHDSTITMLENGRLLRLSKGEFLTLLVRPFIKWIPFSRLLRLQTRGAVLLDIRSSGVFRKRHLGGSINIPLKTLRQCAFLLEKRKNYIICSDISRRAATAAFVLAQQGIDVKILDESMRTALRKAAIPDDKESPSTEAAE